MANESFILKLEFMYRFYIDRAVDYHSQYGAHDYYFHYTRGIILGLGYALGYGEYEVKADIDAALGIKKSALGISAAQEKLRNI